MADHAALLLARAGHEAGGVHEHDERQAEGVAGAHEAGGLGAGVGVEDAAEVPRLVGDDADGAALEAGEPADDVARPARRPLEQAAAVDQALDDVAHVIDAALVVGHGVGGVERVRLGGAEARRAVAGVGRQVVEQVAHEHRRVLVGGHDEVGDAVAVVDLGAAEVGGGDVLAHDVAHDGGAGEEHRRALGHHHEVGEGGRVGAAAGAGAADHRDLRDAARQRDVLAEDAAVAAERREALLHARAAGLDEADERARRRARPGA